MQNPTPGNIRQILKQISGSPIKGLGQNFLIDQNILKKIVQVSEISQDDTVLEIGAGLGSLTYYLCQKAKRVVAIEIDKKFIPLLQNRFSQNANCAIIHGDILKTDIQQIIPEDEYLVVANIPYYITSSLFRHILNSSSKPKRIILTIQHEVAQRICTSSGKMSILALSIQIFGKPEILFQIKPGAFYPPPKVDSSVVKVDLYENPLIDNHLQPLFFQLIKSGFGKKRKTISNSLSSGMKQDKKAVQDLLKNIGIDPHRRAETLSIPEWKILSETWQKVFPST